MSRATWDLVRPGDVLATAPEVLHAGDFYLVLGHPEVNPLPYGWGVIARWPVRVVPRGEGEPWEDTLGAGVAEMLDFVGGADPWSTWTTAIGGDDP